MAEYVYILVNSHMPGLCKIGRCEDDPALRTKQLSSATGVPGEFVLVWHEKVGDSAVAEREVHKALADKRPNPRREFFAISSKEAIETVRAICKRYPALTDRQPALDDGYSEWELLRVWYGESEVNRPTQARYWASLLRLQVLFANKIVHTYENVPQDLFEQICQDAKPGDFIKTVMWQYGPTSWQYDAAFSRLFP